MVQPVPEKIDFSKEEEVTLKLWEEIDAFQTSLKQSKDKPRFAALYCLCIIFQQNYHLFQACFFKIRLGAFSSNHFCFKLKVQRDYHVLVENYFF